ncbi:MAG: S8 family serine peptidase [Gammaproteobacteria bacterium]
MVSLAAVVLFVAGLAACTSGSDDSNPAPGDSGGNNTPTPGDTGGGSNSPDPSLPLINDIQDFTVKGPGWIGVNAGGGIRATSFHWTQVSGGTPYNLINADTRRVEFVVPDFAATSPDDVRTIMLKLDVADDNGNTASDEVVITVPPRLEPAPGSGNNAPPSIDDLPDIVARPGQSVELTATATDAEDSVLSYHWYKITGPSLASLGITAQDLTGPTLRFVAPSVVGKIWFRAEVTDSAGASDQDDVVVDVIGNTSPVANAGGDRSVPPEQTVIIHGGGTDSDGSIATYEWQQLEGPPVALQSANTATVSFIAPNLTVAADILLQLTVTDNLGATATDRVTVTVDPDLKNIPPTANAGPNQYAVPGGAVTLLGSGADDDGTISAYQWTQSSGPLVTINGADSKGASFTMPVDIAGGSTITLQLTVTDNQGATGIDEVVITANRPPTANAGADYSVRPGDTANLLGSGTDPDGSVVSYQWSQIGGEPVTIENENSGNTRFLAPQTPGSVTLRLTVTDNHGAEDTDDVVVTIVPNIPPTADAGNDMTVESGSPDPVVITGGGSDTDGSIIGYHWTQVAGPTVTLIGANTTTVTFDVPTVTVTTVIALRLTVTDDAGATGFDEVSITINAPVQNNPPSVNAGVDQTVNVGDSVTLSATASDPDGDALTYQWSQIDGPSINLSNADTLQASFVAPQINATATITVQLDVTDSNGATAADQVVVTVEPSNAVPVANAGPDITAAAGDPVTIAGSATDSDGTISSYRWTQLPGPNASVSLTNANTATVSFTTPAVTATTTITLRLTVTDDQGATDFDDVNVTVTAANSNPAPVVSAGPDITAVVGETVSITGTATDDGTVIVYIWTQVGSGTALALQNPATETVSFVAPAVSATTDFTLRFTAVDDQGAIGSDEVVITVNPVITNAAPIANAGPDTTVTAGNAVTLTGSGNDNDGSITTYQWSQVNGVDAGLTTTDNPTLQFVAPDVATPSNITLRLTVTDDLGATGFDDTVVTINPAAGNLPPVPNAGPDQSVNIGDAVTLSGSAIDTDGSVSSYQWVQTAGTSVTLSGATSATASFTAPNVSSATPLTFELTATDNSSDSATDTVIVTVYPFATLSGTITTQAGTQTDSDVNDPSAPYTANDSPGTAQPLLNPVVVGGYVNQPSQGATGRSRTSGDVDDYYLISLSANQVINLYIGDVNNGANDLDLYLMDQNNQLVDSSVSPSAATETLTVNSAGNYLINVKAAAGASNYVLSVGVGALATQSNGWRLSDDFAAGDVIVQFKENNGIGIQSLANRAASVGMQAKAGAPGRNMLLGLGTANQRATVLSTLGVTSGNSVRASTNINTNANNNPVVPAPLQEKLDTLLAAKALAKRADVVEAGLNYRYYPTAVPNDTHYDLQWHYPLINLPQAWDITTGDPSVIVAVIDTGVLLNHPDLQGQLVAGYDFIASNSNSGDNEPGIDPNPDDPGDGGGTQPSSFHGTHVAGTIAAASNNNSGVAGIAWGAKIMPCRAMGINGGLSYDIEQCVRYVSGLANDSGTVPPQRADIINLSLGGPTNSTRAPTAFRLARDAGVIVVAAAGNDASNGLFAPAAYDGVVSVSATNISRQLASYSNYGSTIDVSAPGGDSGDLNGDGYFDGVLSTSADDSSGSIVFNFRFAAGTSMASPHMAGVVALMKSVYPDMTPDDLDAMLASGDLTDDLGPAGRDNSFGYGLINAQKAVLAASNAATPSPPPEPPAALQITPTSLNFGVALTGAQMTLANSGGGVLDITNVSNDAGGWLSVTPANVDGNGLGSYNVNVDRSSLADGVYSATVTVASSAGTQTVSVIMQVDSQATGDYAGFHYIELIDASTMELFDRVISNGSNGIYEFSFSGIPLGQYHIRAGSDLDNDNVLCETGDACGAYPTLDIVSRHIIIDGSNLNRSGLNFTTGYSSSLNLP